MFQSIWKFAFCQPYPFTNASMGGIVEVVNYGKMEMEVLLTLRMCMGDCMFVPIILVYIDSCLCGKFLSILPFYQYSYGTHYGSSLSWEYFWLSSLSQYFVTISKSLSMICTNKKHFWTFLELKSPVGDPKFMEAFGKFPRELYIISFQMIS